MDLGSVPRAIREAGFKPEDMNMIAAGEFDRDAGQFTPEGWKSSLRVAGGVPKDPTPRHARIEAAIHGWDKAGSPIVLYVEAIEAAD